MKLDFSVGLGRNEPINEIGDYARLAEDIGFKQVTWVDMPFVSQDVSIMMTLAAQATSKIMIGHGVTCPSTYHPMIIANATAGVDQLSGGRAFVGLGAGGPFGDVYGQAPIQSVRDAIKFIRDFMSGKEAVYGKTKARSESIRKTVPIYLAAEGPRMLQLAGEIADGVISIGTNLEWVKWKLEQVAIGAERAGRDPSEVEYWVRTMIYVADTKEQARKEVSPYPLAYGHLHRFLEGDRPEFVDLRSRIERASPDAVEDLASDSKKVFSAYAPYGVERLDAPWVGYVTQNLIDFFHMTGNPDDINEHIYKLGQLGVKNISPVMFTVIDKKGMMREIGSKIMPSFR